MVKSCLLLIGSSISYAPSLSFFDKTVKFLSVSMGTSISSLVTLQSRRSVTSNFDILGLLQCNLALDLDLRR